MALDHTMDDLPKIPGYEIRGKLGSGGMATVYLAIQQNLDRKIALKIMKASLAADPLFCKRFVNEGKIIAQVSTHPDVVTIFDIGCVETLYFMAMEYVEGGCLTDLLDDRIDVSFALDIVRHMAGALGYAHDQGFVHRDVKPANILFRSDGTPTLTDFGIAKSLSANTCLTKLGFAVGTPEYMSPEQAKAEVLDGRSDLYSLGVVFYEMLTGKRPFQSKDTMSVAMMHINDPVPPLPWRFAEYQPIIDKLLAKKPEDRYANSRDLIKVLDSITQKQEVQTVEVDPSAPTVETEIKPETMAAELAIPASPSKDTSRKRGLSGIPMWGQVSLFVLFSSLVVTAVSWYINSPYWKPGPDIEDGEITINNKELQERIDTLLQVAEAHMRIGRYREPAGSNAYDAYQMVLQIDPENSVARQGIAEIDRVISTN